MKALALLRNTLDRLLVVVCLTLMTAMAGVVISAVIWRTAGASFTWYDEVASVMLCWITYYGAALAALRRAHLGFPTIAALLPPPIRLAVLLVTEGVVLFFFVMMAYFGVQVIDLLQGDTLISLPWVKVEFVMSVIPIGAVLFIVAELTTLPDKVREAWTGSPPGEGEHPVEATTR